MDRMNGFQSAISQSQELPISQKQDSKANYLEVRNFSLSLPDNQRQLVNNLNFTLNSGERILIKGDSGSGKTTFLRALAGLWPYTSGELHQDTTKTELFVAQRPYLPHACLREAICYPLEHNLPIDSVLQKLLQDCGLVYLINDLDNVADWGKILSLGEQQRIAFARILVNSPDIIYLDEATSALDETMERHLYNTLISQLPHSVIVSVGHRSTLGALHTQELNFNDFMRN
jgi:putative ATP-binding cassette transporter